MTRPKMRGEGGRGQEQTKQSIFLSLIYVAMVDIAVTSPDLTFVTSGYSVVRGGDTNIIGIMTRLSFVEII